MELDDPQKPEFASRLSFLNFADRVRHGRRYVWEREVQAFLDTVVATIRNRDLAFAVDARLFRAQLGTEERPSQSSGSAAGTEHVGFGPERMKPRARRAAEGRVNPAGIPVLYLATTMTAAVSEVRPWIGSELSVAEFRIARTLRILNLSAGHGLEAGGMTLADVLHDQALPEFKEVSVWIDIDNAFSTPVTRSDESADYVPTQILAELFRRDYDGVLYKSNFGRDGYNVALFNLGDADMVKCTPYRITSIDLQYSEFGFGLNYAPEPK